MGYWTVNGKPFCQTKYPSVIKHPELNKSTVLICSCSKDEYEIMSAALRGAYPDGSCNQVFSTKWYDCLCPRDATMEKIVREFVDLSLFIEALDINRTSWEIKHIEGTREYAFFVYSSRVAMNGNGFIVGDESYQAKFDLARKRANERNGMQVHPAGLHVSPIGDETDEDLWYNDFMVDLDSVETECYDSPESETCPCLNGDCDCDPDDHYCTEDQCNCESLYTSPMDDDSQDDFVWQEMDHIIQQALDIPLAWEFKHEDDQRFWCIVDRRSGVEIYRSPFISK